VTDAQRADIPTWECLDLIGAASVGRLCFIDGDTPIAYPVSFKLHRHEGVAVIVVRVAPQSLVSKYAGPASFEVDEIDTEARRAWSVIVRGVVRRSHDAAGLPVPEPWISDSRHVWLLLEVGTVTGRRFVARGGNDVFSVEWDLYRGPRS
jgi:nitroimidazol reductase NimA-like FMN-containing flavoprotein (pyridoxamine 5'-phosphate oxidase superfamily)